MKLRLTHTAKEGFTALFCGSLFGIGLALSGMTNTRNVIGFLDIFGHWNINLLWVMCAALLITTTSFHFIKKKKKPLITNAFNLPEQKKIDTRLLLGAILFGIGWGLVGYCPGPVIASIAYLQSESFIFIASMIAGMFIADKSHRIIPTK